MWHARTARVICKVDLPGLPPLLEPPGFTSMDTLVIFSDSQAKLSLLPLRFAFSPLLPIPKVTT